MMMQQIIYGAVNNKKACDIARKNIYCSDSSFRKHCRSEIGISYKRLTVYFRVSRIYGMYLAGCEYQKIADLLFDGDCSKFGHYIKNHHIISLSQFKNGGKDIMEKMKIAIDKATVLKKLSVATDNLTLQEIGVSRKIIALLREEGFNIVSVPGRYNSGYNLGKTSIRNCLEWINNIRVHRYGLPGDYKFGD